MSRPTCALQSLCNFSSMPAAWPPSLRAVVLKVWCLCHWQGHHPLNQNCWGWSPGKHKPLAAVMQCRVRGPATDGPQRAATVTISVRIRVILVEARAGTRRETLLGNSRGLLSGPHLPGPGALSSLTLSSALSSGRPTLPERSWTDAQKRQVRGMEVHRSRISECYLK